jgi:translation initiation factor 2 alpha subunit (eIF-2alpha)
VLGSARFVVAKKIHLLKGDLKRWNKEVLGDLGVKKNRAVVELSRLDVKEEESGLNEERWSRDDLKIELEKIMLMEGTSWRQKLRAI